MITFRPATLEDLTLLEAWMQEPHWRKWWGAADKEIGYIRDMLDRKDSTRPFIFQEDGMDKGYIQVWKIEDVRGTEWEEKEPWVGMVPVEAVGVDLSIGREVDLEKGIGTRALKAFVAKLYAEGCRSIVIDPAPENARAIRAYHKAGFEEIAELLGKTGDSLIMKHKNTEGDT